MCRGARSVTILYLLFAPIRVRFRFPPQKQIFQNQRRVRDEFHHLVLQFQMGKIEPFACTPARLLCRANSSSNSSGATRLVLLEKAFELLRPRHRWQNWDEYWSWPPSSALHTSAIGSIGHHLGRAKARSTSYLFSSGVTVAAEQTGGCPR